ncbi:unnamed protein product, partial [Meganyctiphanes norvegica]
RQSHIGPIIKKIMKDIDKYSAPDQTLNENIFNQLSSWGYRCVYELITIMEGQNKDLDNFSEMTQQSVMKIIINTSTVEEKKKDSSRVSNNIENIPNDEFEYPVETNTNTVAEGEMSHSGIIDRSEVSGGSPRQQVFVINNCGGPQATIHIDDGQMMDDESYLIINEGEKPHSRPFAL